ncbi:MAG: TonB-dependent receptor [Verrucomicrobia bacterium]|nr:TonB-dependent receptor [Verrucomicrobiota bacterium]
MDLVQRSNVNPAGQASQPAGRQDVCPTISSTFAYWITCGLFSLRVLSFESQAAAASEPVDLLQFSLEDLGKIKVTTVSRKSESLSRAAAAVHVITQEDIRRSGVNSIPEALRMAPGLDVARANARQWAISSRGFNDLFANKLLVLMDGRTIYTPLFSGVFWEDTDTFLEDVDRIEVIRGPGATLWGANAVNGVINIITKSAQDTQGLVIDGGGGMEERGFGGLRYGGRLGTNAYYRAYAKYANRDEFTRTDGTGANDNWWTSQEGFRVDWEPRALNRLTLQGDAYSGKWNGMIRRHSLSPPGLFTDPAHAKSEGANVLGRWTHEFSSDAELSVQTYYDRTDREFGMGREIRDTLDLDAQHRFSLGDRHEVVWGAGYRYSVDHLTESADFSAGDPSVGLQLSSGFVQDEIALVHDRLHLILGSKLEHNDFSGFEFQPGARMAWTPNQWNTLWAAVSRAVRTPSRSERGFTFYSDPPHSLPTLPLAALIPASGSPGFDTGTLVAYEAGYKVQPHPRLSLDLAAFYHDYDRLYNVIQLPIELRFNSSAQPYLLLPVTINNALFGESYGVELSVRWQPIDAWRLRANYTFLKVNLHTRGLVPSLTEQSEGDNPQHQISIWSDVDLGRRVEWGMGFRFVDGLPAQNVGSYSELQARLAWKPTSKWELSVVGRDLLHAHHQEFSPFLFISRDVQVDRAVYAKVTLRF